MSEVQSNRLQSRVLLPFARVVMLWAAAAAFFIALGGFGVGVLLYAQSAYSPSITEPPPPQLDPGSVWDPAGFAPEIEYEIVGVNRQRLGVGDLVAVVYSANDLDPILKITILPGAATGRFRIVGPTSPDNAARLIAQPQLRKFRIEAEQKLIDELAADTTARSYSLGLELTFEKDRQPPTTRLEIPLYFAAKVVGAAYAPPLEGVPAPQPPPETPMPTSAATRAAQALALIIDPQRTPAYFAAYQRALRQILQCGPDPEAYAAVLNPQIEAQKPKLKRYNALRFAARVCDLWRAVVAKYAEERAVREAAVAKAAAEALGHRATSMIALSVAGSALATFLMLALALALLAIENHVRVIREGGSASP